MNGDYEFDPIKNIYDIAKGMAPVKFEVYAPPCPNCKHWSPRVRTNHRGEFDGVVLCTADEMHHDFSCYRSKTKGD